MKLLGRKYAKVKRFVRAGLITVFAFLLAEILSAPFTTSTGALFSTSEQNDYTITDFYNNVADNRAVHYLDDNIVIINIDRADRVEIADILSFVSRYNPKAVGLDVTFEDEREGDEYLLETIASMPNLVQPLKLSATENSDSFQIDGASYFFDINHPQCYAATSLPAKFHNSTIREMRVKYPTKELGDVNSFAVKLASFVSPEAVERLKARSEDLELINYHSRRFRVYEPEELADHASEIEGRIVLIGAMTERGDMHPTPVQVLTPGVIIHAHATATILDGSFLNAVPRWVELLISFILCYIIIFFNISCMHKARPLCLRILQILVVYLLVVFGYELFIHNNITANISSALLMVAFGLFACDIWNGTEAIIYDARYKWAVARRQKFHKNLRT